MVDTENVKKKMNKKNVKRVLSSKQERKIVKKGMSCFAKLILVFGVLLVGLGAIRVLSGDEDFWICENGKWERHGMPAAPKPMSICGGGSEVDWDLVDSLLTECKIKNVDQMEDLRVVLHFKDGSIKETWQPKYDDISALILHASPKCGYRVTVTRK